MVVKVEHAGIVNILAGREVVPEYLQGACTPETVVSWVEKTLRDREAAAALAEQLLEVASKLGEGGVHEKVAAEVVKLLEEQ